MFFSSSPALSQAFLKWKMCPGILKIKYLLMTTLASFWTLINPSKIRLATAFFSDTLSFPSSYRKIRDIHHQWYQQSYSCQSCGSDTKTGFQALSLFFFFFFISNLTYRLLIQKSLLEQLNKSISLFHSWWPHKYFIIRWPFENLFQILVQIYC